MGFFIFTLFIYIFILEVQISLAMSTNLVWDNLQVWINR